MANWWLRMSLLLGAVGVAASEEVRDTIRAAGKRAARVGAPIAREVAGETAATMREVGTAATRALTAPSDLLLGEARDHFLSALPVAADTKWRITVSLLRVIARSPGPVGPALDAAGRDYAVSLPAATWGTQLLGEVVQRLARSVDLEGELGRAGRQVTLVTEACPLILDAEAPARVCEVVCGEEASLLHGLADAVGAHLEAPLRMGRGDPHCIRTFTLPG